jgi:hypothetical protein
MGRDENLRAERIRPCVRRQLPGACNVGSLERGSVAAWQRGSVCHTPLERSVQHRTTGSDARARALSQCTDPPAHRHPAQTMCTEFNTDDHRKYNGAAYFGQEPLLQGSAYARS